jgi:hypothetical protein
VVDSALREQSASALPTGDLRALARRVLGTGGGIMFVTLLRPLSLDDLFVRGETERLGTVTPVIVPGGDREDFEYWIKNEMPRDFREVSNQAADKFEKNSA